MSADRTEIDMKYFLSVMVVLLLATSTQAQERYHAARGSGQFTSAEGDFVGAGSISSEGALVPGDRASGRGVIGIGHVLAPSARGLTTFSIDGQGV